MQSSSQAGAIIQMPASLSYLQLSAFFNQSEDSDFDKDGYNVLRSKEFIVFNKLNASEGSCEEGEIFKWHQLKFHLSLPEYNRGLYNAGVDFVVAILMQQQVVTFKILRLIEKEDGSGFYMMSDKPGQEGKDVTIYAGAESARSAKDWQDIISYISTKLAKEKIPPGYRPPGTMKKPEIPVKGTNYFTLRYDKRWPRPDPSARMMAEVPIEQQPIPKLIRPQSAVTATLASRLSSLSQTK